MPGSFERKEERSLMPDIIPMAGVALLIVLFMMMAGKDLLTHEDTEIDIPQASTMERETEENVTLALTVDPVTMEREVYFNDSATTMEAMERRIANEMSKDPYLLVVVRADKHAPSQWVLDILSMAKRSGAQRVAVSTKRPPEEQGKVQ